jgi:hypothetical protein
MSRNRRGSSPPVPQWRRTLARIGRHRVPSNNRFIARFAMPTSPHTTGFNPRAVGKPGRERRSATFAELVATVGLTLSILVAATVVSVGIARADVGMNIIDNESGFFAVALIVGLAFAAMGGLTILHLPGDKTHRHHPR